MGSVRAFNVISRLGCITLSQVGTVFLYILPAARAAGVFPPAGGENGPARQPHSIPIGSRRRGRGLRTARARPRARRIEVWLGVHGENATCADAKPSPAGPRAGENVVEPFAWIVLAGEVVFE